MPMRSSRDLTGFAFACGRVVAIAGLAAWSFTPALADEVADRVLLQRSWALACGPLERTRDLTALQACNLAWFQVHEKDVWHLNLNPHGTATPVPSS